VSALDDAPHVETSDRATWRGWLEANHATARGVWLVTWRAGSGKVGLDYEAAVEEALCFGWVDSLIRRLDADRYARKFTPRKSDAFWSDSNRRRYAKVDALGLIAPAGRERAPSDANRYPPRRKRSAAVPAYIEKAFKSKPRAWATFERLTPRERILYVGWIDNAKREETKTKRIHKAVALLAAGRKLGLV
jgi:uncharacterized protein YdeI (YjbR/CyaY-like superfamily)